MNVLEIIHVRSAGTSSASLSDQIAQSIRGADELTRVVTIYRRDGLVADLAVHIQQTGVSGAVKQTELGLRLASALRAHGIVEHTLWTEA